MQHAPVAQGGHLAAVHNSTQFDANNVLGATYHFWLGGHAGEYRVPDGCDWNIWANAAGPIVANPTPPFTEQYTSSHLTLWVLQQPKIQIEKCTQ